MVEIVKKVQHPATCAKCGTELKYGYDDVKYNKFILYYFINCPVCDAEVRVDDPNLDTENNDEWP
jgi:hypothetical protein